MATELSHSEKLSVDRPYLVLREQEAESVGVVRSCLTVFLTASTCPIGCKMCDLHHHTIDKATPRGAIPRQVDFALKTDRQTDWIKLYNSGNFFDPRSIPVDDYDAILSRVHSFRRVIIENHPRFGSSRLERFRDQLNGRLEVAVGLETVQPRWLDRLGKQMSRDEFDRYASYLRQRDVDLRVFLIVGVPGVSSSEAIRWATLGVRHAVRQGARHISLIPARGVASPLSPSVMATTRLDSNDRSVDDYLVPPISSQAQKPQRDDQVLLPWGSDLGELPKMTSSDFLELQRRVIRWSGGEVVITVDPWDLDVNDPAVQMINQLNLTQLA